jgi:hypothetical protein
MCELLQVPISNATSVRPRSVGSWTAQVARGSQADDDDDDDDDDDVMIRQHTQWVKRVCDTSPDSENTSSSSKVGDLAPRRQR